MIRRLLSFLFFVLCNVLIFVVFAEADLDILNDAAILKERMQYDEAIRILSNSVNLKSSDEAKKFLAKLYYLNGENDKAYKIFKGLKSKDWEVFLYLGLIFEEKKEFSLAISNYLESIKLNENTLALYRVGKIYFYQKKYSKAKDFFLRVIQIDPSIRLANYYLADCFLKLGDYSKAYAQSAKVFQFYPENEKIKKQFFEIKNILGSDFFKKLKEDIEKIRLSIKLPSYRRLKNIPLIKVGIAKNLDRLTLRCGGEFLITDGKKIFNAKKERFYTFVFKNNFVFLRDYKTGKIYEKFNLPVDLKSDEPFYIFDVSYGNGNFWSKKIDRIYRGDFKLIAHNNSMTLINIISIEEYLYGVLPAEIFVNSPHQTLMAQAIIARTNVFKNLKKHKDEGFDVCADIHCQVYQGLSVENQQTNEAVNLTEGLILVDENDKPIDALYHSNCGGCLRTDAFGKLNYLENKFDTKDANFKKINLKNSAYFEERWFVESPSTFCFNNDGKFRWQRVYDLEDFYLAFGFKLDTIKAIVPLKKGECFHYDAVKIIREDGEIKLEGDLKVRKFFDQLRSNSFKIELHFSKTKPTMLFIWGGGFGHGEGLCQAGAINMGRKYNYKEILKHYYPKAKLKKIY